MQVPCKFHLPKAAKRSGLTQALGAYPMKKLATWIRAAILGFLCTAACLAAAAFFLEVLGWSAVGMALASPLVLSMTLIYPEEQATTQPNDLWRLCAALGLTWIIFSVLVYVVLRLVIRIRRA